MVRDYRTGLSVRGTKCDAANDVRDAAWHHHANQRACLAVIQVNKVSWAPSVEIGDVHIAVGPESEATVRANTKIGRKLADESPGVGVIAQDA